MWDSLVKRSDATFKSAQRIGAFFRQFAVTEAEYGKRLMSSTIMVAKDGGQTLIPQEDVVHQCDAGAARQRFFGVFGFSSNGSWIPFPQQDQSF